jgi:hypothetical protein
MTVTTQHTDFEADLAAYASEDFSSEAIETVGYNRANKELYVEFQSGGEYVYEGVEESTYLAFVTADSLGSFWRKNISPRYTSRRLFGTFFDESDEDAFGESKWATTSGDEPEIQVEVDPAAVLSVHEDDYSRSIMNPRTSTFGVKYTLEAEGIPAGPFEPSFDATDETDALRQFTNAISEMEKVTGIDLTVTVKAVTHYFD